VLARFVALLAAIPPLRGTIVSGIYWWWRDTFRTVDFVMDEARPNDGVPYIAGHLDGSADQRNLPGLMRDSTIVVKSLPQEAFAPGKRLPIWHSPDAPNMIVFGEEVNDVPVAALPVRPGLLALAGYLFWLFATAVVGLGLMGWVGTRWTRTYGTLPMRRGTRR
jgi:hypothetical protein